MIFLDLTLKAKTTKPKINKGDYIKLNSFCPAKETVNRIKRQPTKWKKTFAVIYVKGLLSKIHKEVICISSKTNNPIQKQAEDLNTVTSCFMCLLYRASCLWFFTNRRSVEILCYQIMVNIFSNNVFLIKACTFFYT